MWDKETPKEGSTCVSSVAALQEEACLILPAQPLPLELPDG